MEDVQGGVVRGVRRACMVEGMSTREAARVYGLHRDTVRKMLKHSVPPGYRRQSPPRRPKLDPYRGVIDRILDEDGSLPKKQRHTAKRIYDRLRTEYGFGGKYTIVKDYVREHRLRTREMYVPLTHPAGHAQCDFGQARAVIGGVEQASTTSRWTWPTATVASSRPTRRRLPRRSATGTLRRFRFWAGCRGASCTTTPGWLWPRSWGDGRRRRTRVFSELVSHYLFEDRFGRPGKGNDKGKVEGWWAMRDATSWCRRRRLRASMRSTPTWRSAAWSGWGRGCGAATRR